MSNRIKGHMDHTHQSVFHHGLIKLIVCTVLQKNSRNWDHVLFWSGFLSEQEVQAKKSLMNKQFSFVKSFKKELSNELLQDSVQENCSSQIFEDVREALDDNPEKVLKNDEKEQRAVSDHKLKLDLVEKK